MSNEFQILTVLVAVGALLLLLLQYRRSTRQSRYPAVYRVFCASGSGVGVILHRNNKWATVGVTLMTEAVDYSSDFQEEYMAEDTYWKTRSGWKGHGCNGTLLEVNRDANGVIRVLTSDGTLRIFEAGKQVVTKSISVSESKKGRTISLHGIAITELADELTVLCVNGLTFSRIPAREDGWFVKNHSWAEFLWNGKIELKRQRDSMLPTAIRFTPQGRPGIVINVENATTEIHKLSKVGAPSLLSNTNRQYLRVLDGKAYVSGTGYAQVFINGERHDDCTDIEVTPEDQLSVNFEYSDQLPDYDMVDIRIENHDGSLTFNGRKVDATGYLWLRDLYDGKAVKIWDRQPVAA